MTISVKLCGGLGNQLFMVCAALALAARTGQEAVFEFATEYGLPGNTCRPSYFESVFRNLRCVESLPKHLMPLKESGFRYQPLTGNDVLLSGYFQSYLYFADYDVRHWLALPSYSACEATSVHFRRGDYKRWPDLHPLLALAYYRAALTRLKPDSVLIFCEEHDWEDVEPMVAELAAHFSPIPFNRADPALRDIDHLALMSSCRDHVVANSTFSWWGAFLGRGEVCYPAVWLKGVDTRDLFPPEWICIQ